MDTDSLGVRLQAALDGIIAADPSVKFGVPGAVLAVSGRDSSPIVLSRGTDANGLPLSPDHLFPISSASKLATGLLILKLVDSGALDLDAAVGRLLADAQIAQSPSVTVRRLLSHTSGLPLEVPHDLSEVPGKVTYKAGLRWPGELAQACLDAVPVAAPGTGVRYSNIGYGLLGLIAERVCGEPFKKLIYDRVFGPLRIEAYSGELPPRRAALIADIASPYAGTPLEPTNSELSLQIGTPWSGVITTAVGLLTLVRAYLDQSSLISTSVAREARSDQADAMPGGFPSSEAFIGEAPSRAIVWKKCPWGLAVELQGGKRPHWGPANLPQSFGQIGASGCVAWADPQSGTAWALLAARSARSGWLLLHGPRLAQAALDCTGSLG